MEVSKLSQELEKFYLDAQGRNPHQSGRSVRIDGGIGLLEEDIVGSSLTIHSLNYLLRGFKADAGNMITRVIYHAATDTEQGTVILELSGNRQRRGLELIHLFKPGEPDRTSVAPNMEFNDIKVCQFFTDRYPENHLQDALALVVLARKNIRLEYATISSASIPSGIGGANLG